MVTASEHLGELIGESRLLLVIDDVWREAQLRPFLRGGPSCVRLVTTRLPYVLKAFRHTAGADRRDAPGGGGRLIAMNLPVAHSQEPRLGWPSSRIGWATGRRCSPSQTAGSALAWRSAKAGRRHRALRTQARERRAVRVRPEGRDSAQQGGPPLHRGERRRPRPGRGARFGELAILPEDEDVPLRVIEALWVKTGGVDEDQTDDLVRRLDALSLLQSLDLGARTLRLHDNIIWYCATRSATNGCRAAHAAMVQAIGARLRGGLGDAAARGCLRLAVPDPSPPRGGPGRGGRPAAHRLRLDQGEAARAGARGLFESYLPEGQGTKERGSSVEPLHSCSRRLRLTRTNSPGSFLAGLRRTIVPDIADLLLQLHEQAERPALLPIQPTLTLPDTPLIRTMRGHKGAVYALAVLDKARVVSASDDRTLRIWDLDTGVEFSRRFEGHEDTVKEVAVSPTELRAVSGSMDKTIRLWEVNGGTEPRRCEGHEHWVTGVAHPA